VSATVLLVADDEPALRRDLARMLGELWPEAWILEAGDGAEALAAIEERGPAVAFLDIRMPAPNGLEVARRVPEGTAIVFVTAHDQYAVEAFEHAAVDYLLKPVARERLAETLERIRRRAPPALPAAETLSRLLEALPTRTSALEWLRVVRGDTVQLLSVDDVCFFRADRKYTSAFTVDAEHVLRMSISELETRLDPRRFWRIHRSTIVAVASIAAARRDLRARYRLTLRDRPETLTVSAPYARLFRQG
jgi:DNA-binding LytR/AlgR family response regulator